VTQWTTNQHVLLLLLLLQVLEAVSKTGKKTQLAA
jgi:hypothetical protein